MNCSTFRTHWVNYTDLSPESADLPRQCMLPEKPVLITFDDGYRSNYDLVYPILKEYSVKA